MSCALLGRRADITDNKGVVGTFWFGFRGEAEAGGRRSDGGKSGVGDQFELIAANTQKSITNEFKCQLLNKYSKQHSQGGDARLGELRAQPFA